MAATCRYHCRECGRHFSSLNAFDVHRVGPWSARQCAEPDRRFVLTGGVCRLTGPDSNEVRGEILSLAADRERITLAFAHRGRESGRTGGGGNAPLRAAELPQMEVPADRPTTLAGRLAMALL